MRRRLLAPGLAALAWVATSAMAAPLKLHVPSPDWRDQIIYFVMTDRFANGNPANDDQGAGEFGAGSEHRYNGGDLQGLVQRLDYIRGLGATALWITPPVANQWTAGLGGTTGYHGYWASNFVEVDRHLGKLADYRNLSHALHSSGMYLVQDIVVNHTGDFFGYPGGWDPADPTRHFSLHAGSRPGTAPTQRPFRFNDPRVAAHRRAGIYHWTPDVRDYTDVQQEMNFQMSGLDDLNTENPVVRQALRKSYGHWIREVGVDAFRVDTAFYVPADFFSDFLHARDLKAPGIAALARRTGRAQFHVFGEGFGIDKPYQDEQARKIERYMTGPGGEALLPGMLNFPLYGALGDVFARGQPTAELGHRITRMMQLHARPHLMANFVDNHDVDRFLAGGSEAALKQALLAMMTLPGIPVIYYGTEQGFKLQRASMFAAGWGSGGRDRYDTGAPLYRYIAEISRLRQSLRLFSRGTPTVLKDNPALPGVIAWRTNHEDQAALVLLNSADHEVLVDNLQTGWPEGTLLQGLFGIDGTPADRSVGVGGRLTLKLPPRAGMVWRLTPQRVVARAAPATTTPPTAAIAAAPTIDGLPSAVFADDFTLSGHAAGVPNLRLVIDGDLTGAVPVRAAPDGRWQAAVDTSRMTDPNVWHGATVWSEAPEAISETRSFQVRRAWSVVADVADPAGDDHGPAGRYRYPTEASFGANRQMDLQRVKVSTAGGALRLDLKMNKVTRSWNPANGFDHVAFTVYLELPGRPGGATVMPLQQASLPAGMRWHLRLRTHGWSNALFTSEGASSEREGTPTTPAAAITVEPGQDTISLVLPAAALGKPRTLSGLKVYITTWDYDGGYRALTPEGAPYVVGGGAAGEPRVMDTSEVIVLP